jgi:hypothetical protein
MEKHENIRLLRTLGPVREIFPVKDLGFDELLQRDLDDSRVSTQLIPYLLKTHGRQTVRFFPPIICMLLPVDTTTARPLRAYNSFEFEQIYDESREAYFQVTRSGKVGQEHFEHRQPLNPWGEPNHHDFNTLAINSDSTRLVIIDGQHRAMALLALFRNQSAEGWRDPEQEVFKNFYSQWDWNTLAHYDLSGLQLPLTVLYMPTLSASEDSSEDQYDLVQASRSIFLALNKNARPVTTARNRLLDDTDIVAELMRGTLTEIKVNRPTVPLWAVELDTGREQTRIVSPVSLSSVNAVYYIIEHALFGGEPDVPGIGKRSGHFGKRVRLGQAANLLLVSSLEDASRHQYDKSTAEEASDRFVATYGKIFLELFDTFLPYSSWLEAHRQERDYLHEQGNRLAERMLFETGSMRESVDNLSEFYPERWHDLFPNLKTASQQTSQFRKRARQRTADLMIDKIGDLPLPARDAVKQAIEQFLDEYRTIAFQAAASCTFIEVIYELSDELGINSSDPEAAEAAVMDHLKPYLNSLNGFFAPSSSEYLPRLLQFFGAEVPDTLSTFPSPVDSEQAAVSNFRALVLPGELQPDLWPAWRYVLSELWLQYSADKIRESVSGKVHRLRPRVAETARRRAETAIADAEGVKVSSLASEHHQAARERAERNFAGLLAILGVAKPNEAAEEAFAGSKE